MRLGLGLPHLGTLASPEAITSVATAAEEAGLDSLWAMDRLLSPVTPRTPRYPGRADGSLPDAQQTVIDPIVALTVAAMATERIKIGTDVLVAPWYPPALLARSLAALDHVSNGRLVVGLGLGWSVDEFEAVGAPMTGRGRRLDEILDVLSAVWSDGTVEVCTSRECIAPSVIGLKPVRERRPPLLLAADSPGGLERIARRGDGWLPFGLAIDETGKRWHELGISAERHGRDPGQLQLVVRADPRITENRLGRHREPFTGSMEEVRDDVERTRDLGATELIFDFHATASRSDELIGAALALTDSVPALAA